MHGTDGDLPGDHAGDFPVDHPEGHPSGHDVGGLSGGHDVMFITFTLSNLLPDLMSIIISQYPLLAR